MKILLLSLVVLSISTLFFAFLYFRERFRNAKLRHQLTESKEVREEVLKAFQSEVQENKRLLNDLALLQNPIYQNLKDRNKNNETSGNRLC